MTLYQEKKTKLTLSTIENVILFFQTKYDEFNMLPIEQQEIILEYNDEIRKHILETYQNDSKLKKNLIPSTFSDTKQSVLDLPLRDLYIYLIMYDTIIQESKKNNQISEAYLRDLLTNKILLQEWIKTRESLEEHIVPDKKVKQWISDTKHKPSIEDIDIENLVDLFFDKNNIDSNVDFKNSILTIWKKRKQKIFLFIQDIQKFFVTIPNKSINDFKTLFSILECFVL